MKICSKPSLLKKKKKKKIIVTTHTVQVIQVILWLKGQGFRFKTFSSVYNENCSYSNIRDDNGKE